MSQDGPITDADLLAYHQGSLPPARRDAVETHLAASPDDAERVAAWRRQDESLAALYGFVADEPVPARLSVSAIAGKRRADAQSRLQLAAALLLCVGLGTVLGWSGRGLAVRQQPESLVEEAATAHALFTAETVHPVEVAADREPHLATWLSRRLDRPLVIPDLTQAGFRLVGGRLLPAEGVPAAQIMYEDATGSRVTLYMVPTGGAEETEIEAIRRGNLETYVWRGETLACAMVGTRSTPGLQSAARIAYRQIEPSP